MNIFKRLTLILLILAGVVLFFRGWLYRHLVTYKSIGLRADYPATEERLTDYIDKSVEGKTHQNIEHIVGLGLSLTSKHLTFAAGKNDIDPNKLIRSKTAHCVGYAAFFATICNYLLKKYNLADTWIAKPQVGHLYLFGMNAHQHFNSSFFQDHDFATIENKITGQVFAVDPVTSDYLWIDFVTFKK